MPGLVGSTPGGQQTLLDSLFSTTEHELSMFTSSVIQLEVLESRLHIDGKTATQGKDNPPMSHDTVVDKVGNYNAQLISLNNRLSDVITHLGTII